jgi:hypothetical protein
MNIGQVAKMVQGHRARQQCDDLGAGARGAAQSGDSGIRNQDSLLGGTVRRAGRRRRQQGEVAWKVPIGFFQTLKDKGFDKTGTLNIGGSIATRAV